jgi:hypothetical protein
VATDLSATYGESFSLVTSKTDNFTTSSSFSFVGLAGVAVVCARTSETEAMNTSARQGARWRGRKIFMERLG